MDDSEFGRALNALRSQVRRVARLHAQRRDATCTYRLAAGESIDEQDLVAFVRAARDGGQAVLVQVVPAQEAQTKGTR